MATARALQREGFAVTVYDPVPPGDSCSYGNAGHMATDHVRPLARLDVLARVPRMLTDRESPLVIRWGDLPSLLPWFARFAWAGRAAEVARSEAAMGQTMLQAMPAWRTMLDEASARALLVEKGSLIAYEQRQTFEAAAEERAIMRRNGVRLEELSGDEARARAPGLASSIVAGTYLPDTAHVLDPHLVVVRLAEAFVRDGGRIEPAKVQRLVAADARITALATDAGEKPAGAWVALCGGVDSALLLRPLGMKAPLTSERGYHLMLEGLTPGFDIPVSSGERSFAITPMTKGLRLAGTVEFGRRDSPPDWYRAERLLTQAKALFPDLAPVSTSRWMGRRPSQPDFRPSIGRVPRIDNLLVGFGHNHVGLTLAAITGLTLAALAMQRRAVIPLEPFAVERFG
jgi:D-amino-acid dehydrogenase